MHAIANITTATKATIEFSTDMNATTMMTLCMTTCQEFLIILTSMPCNMCYMYVCSYVHEELYYNVCSYI